MSKASTGLLAAGALAMGGLLDVALRGVVLADLSAGLWSAAHDPGKVLFHVVLLPAACVAFLNGCDFTFLSRAWTSHRVVALCLALMLFCLMAWLVVPDPQTGFCERPPQPSDIRDSDLRDDLQLIRTNWQSALWSEAHKNGAQPTSGPQSIGVVLFSEYRKAVADYRSVATGPCSFWTQSTIKGYWAFALTFVAAAFVAFMVFYLSMRLWVQKEFDPRALRSLTVATVLLLPWLALRPYSDWYISFGQEGGAHELLYVAVFVGFILFAMLLLLRPGGRAAFEPGSVIAGLVVIAALVGFAFPTIFQSAAAVIASLPVSGLSTIYGLTILLIVLVVRYELGEDREENDVTKGRAPTS